MFSDVLSKTKFVFALRNTEYNVGFLLDNFTIKPNWFSVFNAKLTKYAFYKNCFTINISFNITDKQKLFGETLCLIYSDTC